ncbi:MULTISPECIES: DUF4157 domain-containing protein [Chryseobacterium]|uniref:Lysine-specific metallo-endopeptidase domain-containing protein n=1 Tax=Candidatus Chryseobacterium massiliense TaxID=204089 RepID=A0A3D9B7N5_9FLAO|nr:MULTISPECIES: DUF4157 domain-containing protein [Chryseobacterium]REC49246.1 hypothetical protein DRF68_10985 [Candidatus Chryseobacterium massiliae]
MEALNLQREQKQTSKKNNSTFFKPAIQKKLSIGSANDSYEVEADKVADKVMKMREPSPQVTHTGALVQRKCAHCEQEEQLQMKPLAEGISPFIQRSSSENGGVAPDHVENQINSSKGGGSVMDHETKNFMESRFEADFSDVKIHTGSEAVRMSRELNAQAFAVGNDIYFNEGKYNPTSDSGKHLLAHELTHTVQQSGGVGRKIQKYSHQDCNETTDLRPHIWPANHIAITMVDNAISALTASRVSSSTISLLDNHFNSHSSSTISSVLKVFRKIKAAFTANNYTYECENDCDGDNAYVYGIWSDIHLCMNNLRGRDNRGIAAIIVHEFSHYYGGTDDNVYYFSFGSGTIPSTLSVSDAIDNADCYEGFAYYHN